MMHLGSGGRLLAGVCAVFVYCGGSVQAGLAASPKVVSESATADVLERSLQEMAGTLHEMAGTLQEHLETNVHVMKAASDAYARTDFPCFSFTKTCCSQNCYVLECGSGECPSGYQIACGGTNTEKC